jgi:hypothetical protein
MTYVWGAHQRAASVSCKGVGVGYKGLVDFNSTLSCALSPCADTLANQLILLQPGYPAGLLLLAQSPYPTYKEGI